mmetsp:Transcript_4993/g.6074  ORF Transcript_4993/g.6074 Transcript_4993/m.6074 type:complete len:408 (-) Transcript_4993:71-1294(-)
MIAQQIKKTAEVKNKADLVANTTELRNRMVIRHKIELEALLKAHEIEIESCAAAAATTNCASSAANAASSTSSSQTKAPPNNKRQTEPEIVDHHLFLANREPVDESDLYKLEEVTIEFLRFFGLLMSIVMLLIGKIISTYSVFNDKIVKDETYIVKLFGFAHTCVEIDFNPSKTVAALILNFATIPLMAFTYLQRGRIANHYNENKDLWKVYYFSKYTWHFRLVSYACFFMVFVNSPDGEYEDPQDMTLKQMFANEAWTKFLAHYIPFFCWQLSLTLMSFEQTWYHYATNTMPFARFPPKALLCYNFVTGVVFVYYNLWIITFVFGARFLGHTQLNEETGVVRNMLWGRCIMYTFLGLTQVVPIFFSGCRVYGWFGTPKSESYVITMSRSNKEDTNKEDVIVSTSTV